MCHLNLLLCLLALATRIHQVYGFAFNVSPPTQCGNQKFTWVDGSPPFNALILVSDGTLRNISIPADAYDTKSAQGSFQFPLNIAQSQTIMFSMSDATGVTAGGISDVLTVGAASAGSSSCNITDPGVDFFYSTDSKLLQCKNFQFSMFPNATQPITVLVTVARGESFYLHPPPGDPFNWKANLTSGSSVMFTMTDSQNRVGGTSELNIVGESDDSSCLHSLPSSAAPTRTPSSPTASSSTTQTQTPSNGGKHDTGIIIGACIAGVVALAIIAAFVYFFSKRSRKHRNRPIDLTGGEPDSSTGLLSLSQPQTPYPTMNPFSSSHESTITPYSTGLPIRASTGAVMLDNGNTENTLMAAGVGAMGAQGRQARLSTKQEEAMLHDGTHQEYYDPYNPTNRQSQSAVSSSSAYQTTYSSTPSGTSSSSAKKSTASPPAQQTPRRLIMHTDMEDEPIELPPMYSERSYDPHAPEIASSPRDAL